MTFYNKAFQEFERQGLVSKAADAQNGYAFTVYYEQWLQAWSWFGDKQ